MKKGLRSFIQILILISFLFGTVTYHTTFVRSNPQAFWNFKERKIIETPEKNSPYSTLIQGEEGKKLVTIQFDSQKGKEQAKIEWIWKIPPKILVPGEKLEMTQSFYVKEWKMDHFVSGSLNSFIQKGDSCVCEGGTDLGTVWMDYDFGNLTGATKTTQKTALIPDLDGLGKNDNKRLQVLVNLKQNNSNYQWIYIYEWKESESRYKTSIELMIGSLQAVVNGVKKMLDSPPFITEGRTFVPFRFLGEAFSASISFTISPQTKQVERVQYKLDTIKIVLVIDSKTAWVNDKKIQMDSAPRIKLNRVMVPLRFVVETLEAEVTWNPKLQSLLIQKK